MKTQVRNFSKNPRTLREAFEVILRTAKAGLLTGGDLRSRNSRGRACYCSIGALLPKEVIAFAESKNAAGVLHLFEHVGRNKMKDYTGMTRSQVRAIITENDSYVGEYTRTYTNKLRKILKDGKGELDGVEFVL